MSIKSLASLTNPCSVKYQACHTFKTALNAKQKAAVVAITALVAILSLPFFGILAVAAFRSMVRKFSVTSTVHGQTPQKLNFEGLRSSSSSISLKEQETPREFVEVKNISSDEGTEKSSKMHPKIQEAIEWGNLQALQSLITPENINARDEQGETVLIKAARKAYDMNGDHDYWNDNHYAKIVKFLLDKGADRTIAQSDGLIALHFAAMNGAVKTVKALVNNETINLQDKNGETPLIKAASHNNELYDDDHKAADVVKLLLENGADPTIKQSKGLMALHLAVMRGSNETVTALVNEKTINALTDEGNSPLYIALSTKQKIVGYFLMTKGALSIAQHQEQERFFFN